MTRAATALARNPSSVSHVTVTRRTLTADLARLVSVSERRLGDGPCSSTRETRLADYGRGGWRLGRQQLDVDPLVKEERQTSDAA
jgi:hypothetical protein